MVNVSGFVANFEQKYVGGLGMFNDLYYKRRQPVLLGTLFAPRTSHQGCKQVLASALASPLLMGVDQKPSPNGDKTYSIMEIAKPSPNGDKT